MPICYFHLRGVQKVYLSFPSRLIVVTSGSVEKFYIPERFLPSKGGTSGRRLVYVSAGKPEMAYSFFLDNPAWSYNCENRSSISAGVIFFYNDNCFLVGSYSDLCASSAIAAILRGGIFGRIASWLGLTIKFGPSNLFILITSFLMSS
jgi:hypothetical protein